MASMQQALAAKRKHEAWLMAHPGVRAVDVGYKIAGGRLYSDWLSIRIFVESKGDFDPKTAIPEKIDGVPTDVIEVGPVRATVADNARYRPLEGSISASANQAGLAGTLSAIVRDRTNRVPMALSASHVFAPDDNAALAIIQPSIADGGTDPTDRIAASTTRRSRIAGVTGVGGAVGRDCAVAMLSVETDVTNMIEGIGPINGSTSAELGTTVKKRGRTSGLTFGLITGLDATVTVDYANPSTIPTTTYYHQISIAAAAPSTIFQDVGDSGALLLNTQNEAIGLTFASSTDHVTAWATPMQTVLDALGVDLVLEGLYENRSILSWQNQLDRPGAVLTASSEAGTMGVKNLIVPHTGVKWRTIGATAPWITADIGASREIAVVGLFGTNLTDSAYWRVRLSNVGVGNPDVWDTGLVQAHVYEGYRQVVLVLPSPVQARYVRIDLDDAGAAGGDGYYEVGVLWVGSAWQPSLNFAIGYSDGWIDPSVISTSRGGQTYVDKRPKYRVRSFIYDMLGEDELYDEAHEMERLVGVGDNVLMVPEPLSTTTINRQALLGRLTQLSPSQMVSMRTWQVGFSLVERL